MKHLIIFSHINLNSFTKAIVDKISEVVLEANGEVKVIDLIKDEFNPVMNLEDVNSLNNRGAIPKDVLEYQNLIKWSEKITIVYPLWWGQMPSQLKGFFDRVFTNGFAFSFDENGPIGLLKDKQVQIIVNTGSPSEVYKNNGMLTSLNKVLDIGLFSFCGIKPKTLYFGSVTSCSNDERKDYLKSLEEIYKQA